MRKDRRRLRLAIAMAFAVLGLPSTARAQADVGKGIFQEKCTACHTIGGGKRVGPDLKDVTTRRDHAWLMRWIREPDKVLAAKDPIAMDLFAKHSNVPMPPPGLSDAQITAVLAYIDAASQGGAAAAATAPALPPGSAARGRELFTGVTRLANGGPPCMGCHSVGGIGALGGGALGPDLTAAFEKYGGEAGLGGVLSSIQFPTMKPIFGERPLVPQEAADLVAYLQSASVTQRDPESMWKLAGLSVAVGAFFMFLAHAVWRRRLTSVRRRMVAGLH